MGERPGSHLSHGGASLVSDMGFSSPQGISLASSSKNLLLPQICCIFDLIEINPGMQRLLGKGLE